MDHLTIQEIEQLFNRLSLDSKLRVIESLVRRVRLGTPDAQQFERDVKSMANDPEIQRELGQMPAAGETHAAG